VTRYSTNGFLRLKLGEALAGRGVAPHIYESSLEARTYLAKIGEAGVAPSAPSWRACKSSLSVAPRASNSWAPAAISGMRP